VATDEKLLRQVKPKILVEGEECSFYPYQEGKSSPHHTHIELVPDSGDNVVRFVLKKHPSQMATDRRKRWNMVVDRDWRPPVIVSVIKAAYLTPFKMLGYGYALSSGGILRGLFEQQVIRADHVIGRLSKRAAAEQEPAQLRPRAVPFPVKCRQALVDPGVDAQVLGGQRRPIVEHKDHSPQQKPPAGLSIRQALRATPPAGMEEGADHGQDLRTKRGWERGPRSRSLTNHGEDDRVDAPDEETRSNEERQNHRRLDMQALPRLPHRRSLGPTASTG
jgi:hypothetical protein